MRWSGGRHLGPKAISRFSFKLRETQALQELWMSVWLLCSQLGQDIFQLFGFPLMLVGCPVVQGLLTGSLPAVG